ncbi:hypothetical protein BU16DRAFT_531710 [Lophium mytilinum]|uniref:Uncharacterized protein n=1 Tax=Lophium mytilinum TaxID=390894 RepID=A0A6A6QAK1_9PEZI|nr:hypothetical protein BU16DRAFT_531710 [Lophium mytilinum]
MFIRRGRQGQRTPHFAGLFPSLAARSASFFDLRFKLRNLSTPTLQHKPPHIPPYPPDPPVRSIFGPVFAVHASAAC